MNILRTNNDITPYLNPVFFSTLDLTFPDSHHFILSYQHVLSIPEMIKA